MALEACGGAHHWARELMALGHEVRLNPPAYVKPFVKRHKNDAVDAEAICEAAQRPTMRFVAVKSEEQQASALIFRTATFWSGSDPLINAVRGHLTEYGWVAPKAVPHGDAGRSSGDEMGSLLPPAAVAMFRADAGHLADLDDRIAELDGRLPPSSRRRNGSQSADDHPRHRPHYRNGTDCSGSCGRDPSPRERTSPHGSALPPAKVDGWQAETWRNLEVRRTHVATPAHHRQQRGGASGVATRSA